MRSFANIKRLPFYLCLWGIWLLLWLFNSFFNHPKTFALNFLNEVWQSFFLVFVNYLFFEYCLPSIIKKRATIFFNILTGILLGTILLALVSFGLYAWNKLGMELHIYTQFRFSNFFPGGFYSELIDGAFFDGRSGVASVFFFGVAKLFHYNFMLRQTAQQMQLEKQEAELNYLKSQTNPHFLFNTLNNIYALAQAKSDLAPEAVLRLSKILRFMLYETNVAFIPIEQELEIIRDYIELEKLRYDDSLRIDLQFEIENQNQLLPPLLLIPLVENAFKHGVAETRDGAFLVIQLSVKQQQLTFVVRNSTEKAAEATVVKENIGLSNLRRQLQLLYTDYKLAVNRGEAEFTATLRINLASHV